jgi:hypothetical protein
MGTKSVVGVAAAAVAAGVTAAKKVRSAASDAEGRRQDPTRWRAVTIDRPPGEVAASTPAPLAELGDAVEVRVIAAPGDKGTELGARYRTVPADTDPEEAVRGLRTALRLSKQLAEVGWITHPDDNVTTESTALNAPLRKAIKLATGEGLL